MLDPDFAIDRSRRRDPVPDPDADADVVSAGAGSSGELHGLAHSQSAAEKLANWIRDAAGDTCTSYEHPLHSFDRCVTDRSPGAPGGAPRTSILYLQEKGDADPISPSDVRQRRLGDCALMATLGGLAGSTEGRAVIQHAIAERKNDRGEVIGYSVSFYEPHSHLFGPKTFTPMTPIEVSSSEAYVNGHARAPGDATHDEVWPLVMEKAYAKLCGGYDAIAHGDRVRTAMEALLGKNVNNSRVDGATDAQLQQALSAHALVVLSSNQALGRNPEGVAGGHAYFVKDRVDLGGGNVIYKLGNPWDGKNTVEVPAAKLVDYFYCVDVGAM